MGNTDDTHDEYLKASIYLSKQAKSNAKKDKGPYKRVQNVIG